MATFLFWNIGRRQILDEVAAAVRENDVDILILAESQLNPAVLMSELNRGVARLYATPFNPSTALTFLIRYAPQSFEPLLDEGGISLRRFIPPIGREMLIAAMHLPSKLFSTAEEQTLNSVRASQLIRAAEERLQHQNTIVIGDLNMSPFEPGVVAADGLHGVMDKQIALRGTRLVNNQTRPFFYNPMWNYLGDEKLGPPGTYYYGGGAISHFWHMFDQVLLRPSMLNVFSSSKLKIITEVNGRSLLRNNRINRSIADHLPIAVTFDVESEPT
jgi:hypothetical protein